MLNISEELKKIYKNDSLPYTSELSYKELILTFTDGTNTITVKNNQLVSDSFSLTESLCSDTDLTFGGCEASQFKITVADVETELKGMTLTVVQRVNNTYEVPLGVFVVESAKKQADLRFKDVVAYDYCKKLDVDVAEWYNALTWPLTLKAFRVSLFNYLGIECEEQTLVNDNVLLTKTINPETLLARDVAKQIAEINGTFGHMSREGKFKYIVLSLSYGLYPSVRLFPNPLLFPVSPNDASYNTGTEDENIVKAMYKSVEYEEYKCEEITKLQIRQESGDIGVIVGDGTNAYVIEGNFLVFGKSSSELQDIATRAFGNMKKRPYRPFRGENIGLPYIEVGDSVSYEVDDQVVSYIMSRTLTGIHALTDTYEATGNKERTQVESVRTQIQRLKGKTNVLIRDVDRLSNTITNVEEGLETKIEQTDRNIELKVDKNGVINAINLSTEGLKIDVNKLDITGLVTINSLKNGTTIIDGSCITTGTINAERIGTGILTSMVIRNDNLYIDGSTIQFYGSGAIKRSGSNSWSTSSRYLDNVISFTSQTITLGQYSGDLNNNLDIPMKAINIGYSGNTSYSSVNIYAGAQCRLFVSSSDYLSFEYSSVAREKIAPHGAWDLGSSSYPFQALYINQLYHLNSGTIGFFGTTPKSRQTVSKLSTSADLSSVITKINALLDALGTSGYGLISL